MEVKIKKKSEGLQLMLEDNLEKISEYVDLSAAFKEYFFLETSYSSFINNSKLEKQIDKKKLYSLLSDYYYKSSNEDIILLRRTYEKDIKNVFYSFILTPNFSTLIEKLFGDEGESSYDINKNNIIKGVHATFYDIVIRSIRNSTSLNIIPEFILYYDKKIVDSKINDLIKFKFGFNYNDREKKSIEYKYLENLFNTFKKDLKPPFDSNIYDLEFRLLLFKLIVLVNHTFIKRNEKYHQKFLDRFKRYYLLLQLENKKDDLLTEYNNYIKKTSEEIEKEKNEIIQKVKDDLFKIDEKSKKNHVIIIHDDKSQEIKALNKKYLKLIFSLSLMFNNIVVLTMKNNKDGIEEYTYKISSKIKCSAIERQFLLNILNVFKEEKSFLYNYLLETYIYENVTQKYNSNLYSKLRDNDKIIIPYNTIINAISGKNNIPKEEKNKDNNNNTIIDNNKDNKDKIDDKDNNIINTNDSNNNIINEKKLKNVSEENQIFISEFKKFFNKNKKIFDQQEVKKGFFGNIFSSKIPQYIDTPQGKIVNYLPYNLKLIPIVNHRISSSQITIVIDGSISEQLYESDQKNLSHADILNSFFTNNQYINSDFYCYSWQTLNYQIKSELKEVTAFYGKILAFILISRLFFQFQTINLIGNSTGCKIIKHCLLEMREVKNKLQVYDLINNIIFIGGVTTLNLDKYPDIFDNVTGKIVNIFSKNDKLLSEYKKKAIGLNELKNKTEGKYNYDIINIDLSKKYINQEEYIYELPKIFIKNFNIN